MALRFFDGFDHYPASEALHKWSTGDTDMQQGDAGRFGGVSLRLQGNRQRVKVLDAQGEWIVGFGFQPGGSGSCSIMAFLSGGTVQDDIFWNHGPGNLTIRRGGSTVVATGTKVLNAATWYYIEWRIVFHDTTGIAQVYVDSVLDINASGLDTNNAGGNTADRLRVDGGGVAAADHVDDLYLCDATGSAPYNTFLGDCRVEAIYPNGNGNSSQLDGSDGNQVDNYLLVDETNSDDDTTYVESSDVGDKDTYAYGNVTPASGTVHAVQILPWARKTDAGARSIVSVARHSGTEEDSAAITLPSSYTYVTQDIRTTKPGGGSWSISDVNNAEFGVKINA